eukprot:8330720-Alexandrium_andersonii.AAC.1
MHFSSKLQESLNAFPLLRNAGGQPRRDTPGLPKLRKSPWVDAIEGALVVPGAGHVRLPLTGVSELQPREESSNDALNTPATDAAGCMARHDVLQPLRDLP